VPGAVARTTSAASRLPMKSPRLQVNTAANAHERGVRRACSRPAGTPAWSAAPRTVDVPGAATLMSITLTSPTSMVAGVAAAVSFASTTQAPSWTVGSVGHAS
jgi:hypothetical protein